MSGASGFTVKFGNKEMEINLELYRVVQDYLKNSYTLDVLAEKLGLDGWSEAYEFMAALPQWVIWLTESQLKEYLSRPAQEQQAQPSAPKRAARRKKEKAEEKPEEKQAAPAAEKSAGEAKPQ